MNYQCYFREGFTPQSGIDTITIWLHPAIISDPRMFHEYGNNNEAINLRFKREISQKTGTPIRTNYFVDIQAEAIDPFSDIFGQVLVLLENLTFNNIIHRPQEAGMHGLKRFFCLNFDRLFAVDALDFYFDLQREDMRLVGKPHPTCPNTRYSSPRSAVLKAYSRDAKLRQKKHIPFEEIENMDYPSRIEFSLCRENCEYLDIHNLSGAYENVFLRYLPFLARKWFNYRSKVVEVSHRNLNFNHHLSQIIAVAGQRIPQYTDLYRTPPKPIPYKSVKKNEVDCQFMARFYSIT